MLDHTVDIISFFKDSLETSDERRDLFVIYIGVDDQPDRLNHFFLHHLHHVLLFTLLPLYQKGVPNRASFQLLLLHANAYFHYIDFIKTQI